MRRWLRKRARQSQQEQIDGLSQRLAQFERVVEAETGLSLEAVAGDGVRPEVPPSLIAACRCPRPGGEPVRMEVRGAQLVAVVSGRGDPEQWYDAVATLAHPTYAAQGGIPRIGHRPMPDGLLAVARRGTGTAVWVAADLPPQQQRQAAAVALRAGRSSGWHTPVLLPAAAFGAHMAWQAALAHLAEPLPRIPAATAAKWGVSAGMLAGAGALAVTLLPAQAHPAHSVPSAVLVPHHKTTREVPEVPRGRSLAPGSVPPGRDGRSPALAGLGAPPSRSPGQPSPSPSSLGLPLPSPTVSTPPLPHPTATAKAKVCIKWKVVLGVRICVKTSA